MPISDSKLSERLRTAFADRTLPARIAVAVSGGGDSVALLVLLRDWARTGGPAVTAVTVDHGLRPEAADEAVWVEQLCGRLNVSHAILRWQDRAPRGNLMAAARQARLTLIADWARAKDIDTVALGHTADDQAETLVMRLARGSGADGLSGMAMWRRAQGIAWVRPLLGTGRQDLRDLLVARKIPWIEDPTNDDERFDRVRVRKALALLEPLGITRDRLVDTAALMAQARGALEHGALRAARACAAVGWGEVYFQSDLLSAEPAETRLRLLAHAINWVGGGIYRPRLASLRHAEEAVMAGHRRTLGGCQLRLRKRVLTVGREMRAAMQARAAPGEVWDGRFILIAPHGAPEGIEVRALGDEGLAVCNRHAMGSNRTEQRASPAAWLGDELVAAPLAGEGHGWQVLHARDPELFFLSILSH